MKPQLRLFTIPIDRTLILSLKDINQYWGFRNPDAVQRLLAIQIWQGQDFQFEQPYDKELVRDMMERSFNIPDKEKMERVLFVLWLNANLNGHVHTILDVAQGSYDGRCQYADKLRLYNMAKKSLRGQQVRISVGDSKVVTLENNNNWFTDFCLSLVGYVPADFDGQAELNRVTHVKTSTKDNEEKWGVMYGTYRFLKDMGVVRQRTEPFWAFIFGYLSLVGLEDRAYTRYDPKLRKTPNSKISTYNKYCEQGKVYVIPRYEPIQLMSLPLEIWNYLVDK